MKKIAGYACFTKLSDNKYSVIMYGKARPASVFVVADGEICFFPLWGKFHDIHASLPGKASFEARRGECCSLRMVFTFAPDVLFPKWLTAGMFCVMELTGNHFATKCAHASPNAGNADRMPATGAKAPARQWSALPGAGCRAQGARGKGNSKNQVSSA